MIGIDVGGANLKVVDEDGAHIHYCPLWTGAPIADLLMPYAEKCNDAGDSEAAVVMSGELADCFAGKMEGIAFIVREVQKAFPDSRFYGTDARFHDGPVPELAAANWLASADFLREKYPGAVLLDVGSTTADIIPLSRFDTLKGMTDLMRLQAGYLIYTGMLRTPVAVLVSSVSIAGVPTPVSSEYFAATADVHLVLGNIAPEEYSCDTPDKKEKTRKASLCRLARVVCADLEEIGTSGAEEIARAVWDRQRDLVCSGARSVAKKSGTAEIIVAGIGAQIFSRECRGTDLTHVLGANANALPAYAVREVALRNSGN
ncbi:MAG: hydantoinase/oxoprolinase family protein [Methanoregula sp.]|jgi:hypothetical protein